MNNSTEIEKQLEAQAHALASLPEGDVDLSDLPEQLCWDEAERAKFYRPTKQSVSIRLDCDVLAWFKAHGDGYQTRINKVLREYVITHTHK